ncbi:AraC family transcriptional regulator [Sulfurimonas sp.]|uniref:helix-turn-helix domain-containing protein n=1 Tax=Sulfurimonas sp. TaxID=2022749 RepID=UPI00260A49DD|nr:AraC family transcriptional regulator [Sulfurimonas sp.]
MESLFFNITDTSYRLTPLLGSEKNNYITRVDISNGIVFLNIALQSNEQRRYKVKNLDRMLVIVVTKKGSGVIQDHQTDKSYNFNENSINLFCSSKQDLTVEIDQNNPSEIFVLFIADFILKRYRSGNTSSIVDYLYNKLQDEISLECLDSQSIDALSLYIIKKITKINTDNFFNSIMCEQNVLEFMIHRFKLLDVYDNTFSDDELCISRSAKDFLLRSFVNPPTIKTLAHLCATNETKLKVVFKKKYKMTIHQYIQKLRLEKANFLLKEQMLNIGEITKEVGYKHQGYFSKLFFEYYGVYPKDLLKK